MRTRAVLFDLGNTLVTYYRSHDFPNVLDDCLESILDALGLDRTRVDWGHLRARALELNTERADLRVRPLEERLRVLLAPIVELDRGTALRVCHAFLDPIFQRARLDADAQLVLRSLRDSGLATAIISNTPWGSPAELWHAELQRHGLSQLVDAVVFCVDVGWRKPHPAPFAEALRRVNILPQHASFVGDDPRWDVLGAQGAGLRPILLAPDRTDTSQCSVIGTLRELLPLLSG